MNEFEARSSGPSLETDPRSQPKICYRQTDRQTDKHTHSTMYRVPPELKIFNCDVVNQYNTGDFFRKKKSMTSVKYIFCWMYNILHGDPIFPPRGQILAKYSLFRHFQEYIYAEQYKKTFHIQKYSMDCGWPRRP